VSTSLNLASFLSCCIHFLHLDAHCIFFSVLNIVPNAVLFPRAAGALTTDEKRMISLAPVLVVGGLGVVADKVLYVNIISRGKIRLYVR
jgi:hypothetical protein